MLRDRIVEPITGFNFVQDAFSFLVGDGINHTEINCYEE